MYQELRLQVYDSGLGNSTWATGDDEAIGAILASNNFSRDEPGWYDKIASWGRIEYVPSTNSSGELDHYVMAKNAGTDYEGYLNRHIDDEFKVLVEEPLERLREAATIYIPFYEVPMNPREGNEISFVKIDEEGDTLQSLTRVKFCFVQYGYKFVNAKGGESDIVLWSKSFTEVIPKEVQENGATVYLYPRKLSFVVPMDPWNVRGVAFASKANEMARNARFRHQDVAPPISSTGCRIYRRIATGWNLEEFTNSNSRVIELGSLAVSGETLVDTWTSSLRGLREH